MLISTLVLLCVSWDYRNSDRSSGQKHVKSTFSFRPSFLWYGDRKLGQEPNTRLCCVLGITDLRLGFWFTCSRVLGQYTCIDRIWNLQKRDAESFVSRKVGDPRFAQEVLRAVTGQASPRRKPSRIIPAVSVRYTTLRTLPYRVAMIDF